MPCLSLKIKRCISFLLIGSALSMMPSQANAVCPYKYVVGCLAAAALVGPYLKPMWEACTPDTKTNVKIVLESAVFATTITSTAYLIHSYNTKDCVEEEDSNE